MEPQEAYKSFNSVKSLEELQYNLTKYLVWLRDLEFELHFYAAIMDRPIFKTHVMNLFEMLSGFKKNIDQLEKKRMVLLHLIMAHLGHLTKKVEGQSIGHAQLLIDKYDETEKEMFSFNNKMSHFKFGFYQYMQSVINQ